MRFPALLGAFVALTLTVACGVSDDSLTNSVKKRLATDGQIKADKINVETRERVVTLTGTADSEAERERAFEVARTIDGVTEVVNNITVLPIADIQSAASTGTTGEATARSELPGTASALPIVALVGTVSLLGGIALLRFRRRRRYWRSGDDSRTERL